MITPSVDIREYLSEAVKKGTFEAGVTKKEFLDLKLAEIVVESDQIDLLVMGRPEGAGCYCAVNNILRSIIDTIGNRYDYVVMDCEAGMEHISRQTTRNLDGLIIVSEPSMRSLNSAVAIKELIAEIRTKTGKIVMVVNRIAKELPGEVWRFLEENGLTPALTIPVDAELYDLELQGRPVIELPPEAPLPQGVRRLALELGL